jgi:hypothetical protein
MTTNTANDTEHGLDGEYVPSPLERIRKQVADYEASAGTPGGTVEGAPAVILTSVGVKSGKVRKNPVVRIVDGDRYVAVASPLPESIRRRRVGSDNGARLLPAPARVAQRQDRGGAICG